MCLNPLHGFVIGKTLSGKNEYKIEPGYVNYLERYGNAWHAAYPGHFVTSNVIKEYIMIACGQCMECRLAYSRMWANRMMLEAQNHESNYFLTLTYDDEHVPISYYGDPDTGEALPSLTLVKRDLQLFVKRLRRLLDYRNRPEIRFYACGEYGSKTHRPHYHIIVFGLVLDDLEQLKTSPLGFPYFRSSLIEQAWPNGYSMVCNVSWDTCAYVARYVTKKWTGDYKEFYETFNILPEFSLMSRRPGIGRDYYEAHKDEIYQYDEINLSTPSGGKVIKPCAYYDHLYDLEHPELMADIKARRRRKAEAVETLRQSKTDLSIEEQLQARTYVLMQRLSKLPREEI